MSQEKTVILVRAHSVPVKKRKYGRDWNTGGWMDEWTWNIFYEIETYLYRRGETSRILSLKKDLS